MEDLRVLWMRDRVSAALGLRDESLFLQLLQRNEARTQHELLAYLDQPAKQLKSSAVLFHVCEAVIEVEKEEPERKILENVYKLTMVLLVDFAESLVEEESEDDGQESSPASQVTVDHETKETEESGKIYTTSKACC